MAAAEIVTQLRMARIAAGLSQNHFADSAGYSRAQLQKAEAGENSPSVDAMEAYAGVLDLQVHLGPPEGVAPLLASALARMDEYIQVRATELSAKRVAAAERDAKRRVAHIKGVAVARADRALRDDRDYWRQEAREARRLLEEARTRQPA